jgi:hypothetical protein
MSDMRKHNKKIMPAHEAVATSQLTGRAWPRLRLAPLTAVLMTGLLGACVTVPNGPGALVLPGTGKTFDQFRFDEGDCRQYAQDQLGGATAGSVAADSGVRSAALGTILGAVAGAAIGGSHGAAVGAGSGLALGGLAGTGAAQGSAYNAQQRYDFSYQQCMYAKGHRVPVAAGSVRGARPARTYESAPPVSYSVPPPPPSAPNYGYGAPSNTAPQNNYGYGAPGNMAPPPPPPGAPPAPPPR